MLTHIAIFKWREGTSKERIQKVLEEVRALQKKIPGVTHILTGENFSLHGKHFTHGVVVLAENQEAIDAYRNHPDHQQVAKEIEEVEEDGIGIDFIS